MSDPSTGRTTPGARINDLWRRRPTVRRIRLASGLVLFAYVLSHLLNHAVGLVSLAAMEGARVVFMAAWGSWPGLVLLYGALLAHGTLAFVGLYRKRSLRMARWEAMQYLFGLAVPPLLFEHIIGTRIA
jgi:adenylate cyclase